MDADSLATSRLNGDASIFFAEDLSNRPRVVQLPRNQSLPRTIASKSFSYSCCDG